MSMPGRGDFDRRRFIVGASAAGLSFAVPGLAGAETSADDLWAGRLEEVVGSSDAIVTLEATGVSQRVSLVPGAEVLHGRAGAVDDLSPFVPGESVVMRVSARDDAGAWQVEAFQSLFTGITTTVTDAGEGSDSIDTASGSMALAPAAQEDDPVDAGTTVKVTVWTDPDSGDRYANAVIPQG